MFLERVKGIELMPLYSKFLKSVIFIQADYINRDKIKLKEKLKYKKQLLQSKKKYKFLHKLILILKCSHRKTEYYLAPLFLLER